MNWNCGMEKMNKVKCAIKKLNEEEEAVLCSEV